MKSVRCAIYTRKSSEEGLEQDFNSLDAQREACAAYVASQVAEGWALLPERYDDGGISGGTLERPALKRLLQDVNESRIDIIVVYKVDRLTRSLLDFAKLVEAFDASGVSFVSVTQSFNSTTSMGRLTLNMLLSFAQFEREVTAERIRDKIAASKAKGMWMGGIPPIGYAPEGRSLRIVEEDAALIRDIFARYLDLKNVRLVAESLQRDGVRTPKRLTAKGRTIGGRPFSRGQIYKILANPIYTGRIVHKKQTYPGNHRAIIDDTVFDAAKRQLGSNTRGKRVSRHACAALLAGLIRRSDGTRLIHVHTSKPASPGRTGSKLRRRRYGYYVSKDHHHRQVTGDGTPALRIPAREIEQLVTGTLKNLLADPLDLAARFAATPDPRQLARITGELDNARTSFRSPEPSDLAHWVRQVTIHHAGIEITLQPATLASLIGISEDAIPQGACKLSVPARLTRTGRVIRYVDRHGAAANDTPPNPGLIRSYSAARRWWDILAKGDLTIAALARHEGVTPSYISRVIRLAFLAPSIVEAMIDGSVLPDVSTALLRSRNAINPDWKRQEHQLLPG